MQCGASMLFSKQRTVVCSSSYHINHMFHSSPFSPINRGLNKDAADTSSWLRPRRRSPLPSSAACTCIPIESMSSHSWITRSPLHRHTDTHAARCSNTGKSHPCTATCTTASRFPCVRDTLRKVRRTEAGAIDREPGGRLHKTSQDDLRQR